MILKVKYNRQVRKRLNVIGGEGESETDNVTAWIQVLGFGRKSNTLNSVGTISLGVSNPINISRPTKHMIDMKMEKSLISFLS